MLKNNIEPIYGHVMKGGTGTIGVCIATTCKVAESGRPGVYLLMNFRVYNLDFV